VIPVIADVFEYIAYHQLQGWRRTGFWKRSQLVFDHSNQPRKFYWEQSNCSHSNHQSK